MKRNDIVWLSGVWKNGNLLKPEQVRIEELYSITADIYKFKNGFHENIMKNKLFINEIEAWHYYYMKKLDNLIFQYNSIINENTNNWLGKILIKRMSKKVDVQISKCYNDINKLQEEYPEYFI